MSAIIAIIIIFKKLVIILFELRRLYRKILINLYLIELFN
jgi:hypothetical protein